MPVVDEHLHGDMVSARVEMRLDACGHRVDVAPCADRVDEPVVASVGEVVVAEAEAAQVVRVVGQPQVRRRVPPRDLARHACVRRQHTHLLRGEQLAGAEGLPSPRGVLGRNEVGVRTVRLLRGELQHLRAERRENTRWLRVGHGRAVDVVAVVHALEVLAHERERLAVVLTADVEQRLVRDTDAEHEPTREGLAEGQLARCHRQRVPCPDVRDARRDDEGVGRGEQQLRGGEHLTADRLTGPQCAVAELLHLAGRVADDSRRREVELPGPDADASDPCLQLVGKRHAGTVPGASGRTWCGSAAAASRPPAAASTAATSIATWYPCCGNRAPALTPATAGRTATAMSDATRATALLTPLARPACRGSRAPIAVDVIGATTRHMPAAKSSTPGSTPVPYDAPGVAMASNARPAPATIGPAVRSGRLPMRGTSAPTREENSSSITVSGTSDAPASRAEYPRPVCSCTARRNIAPPRAPYTTNVTALATTKTRPRTRPSGTMG